MTQARQADGFPLAGWFARLAGSWIDVSVVLIVVVVTPVPWFEEWQNRFADWFQSWVVSGPGQLPTLDELWNYGVLQAWFGTMAVATLIGSSYNAASLLIFHRTLGQQALGLRVVERRHGLRPQLSPGLVLRRVISQQVLLHWLYPVYLVGGLIPLFNRDRQALWDLVASSQVVHDPGFGPRG